MSKRGFCKTVPGFARLNHKVVSRAARGFAGSDKNVILAIYRVDHPSCHPQIPQNPEKIHSPELATA